MAPRILIAGGYGTVGSLVARHIRSIGRDTEIVLAGRNPEKGAALAAELGNASTAALDIDRIDTAMLASVDLIVSALYDPAHALTNAALASGIAHIGITNKADDIAPITFAALRAPPKRPIVLAGYAAAGVAMIVAQKAATGFRTIDSTRMTALFDPRDAVGPMTAGDVEFLMARALVRERGQWAWVEGLQHPRTVVANGQQLQGYPTALLDAPGLGALTGASDVRVDLVQGNSLGTLAGGRASSDTFIDIEGATESGMRRSCRTIVSDPNGLMNFTALGILLAVERVLGLDGRAPAAGGLYLPETLVAFEVAIPRLQQFGVRITCEQQACDYAA